MKRRRSPKVTPGKCRICGCTDERACAVGCSWIQEDLCSVCADVERAIVDLFLPRSREAIEKAVLAELADLVEEGDCDPRRIRRALRDLVAAGAIEKPSRTTYALAEGVAASVTGEGL